MANSGIEVAETTNGNVAQKKFNTIELCEIVLSWIKDHQVLLQAIFVWMIVCLPGNIVTFVLYLQLHHQYHQDEAPNQVRKDPN